MTLCLVKKTQLVLAASAVLAVSVPAFATNYVTVDATRQGRLKPESTSSKAADKIAFTGFHYELVSPRDPATGQSTGKRQHSAVCLTKTVGASSPQFFSAAASNELLKTVFFEFYKTNANGEEYVYHTIKLTNASVSKIVQNYVATTNPRELISEEICFTFQKIEIENKDGKTMAVDDWTSAAR